MMKEKLLTIAIPTYNRVEFLNRSLNSILKQFEDEVEILVSDNASTDETFAYMSKAIEDYPHINYVRNENNIGPDNNFLQCYNLAAGKFVLLLGDDDVLMDGALKEILSFLKTDGNDCLLVFLNHAIFKNEYTVSNCAIYDHSLRENILTTDKKTLMDIAQDRITYMSAFLLQKSAFLKVNDPKKYNNTFFMHTCIAFEATADKDALLGIIAKPCVAQDATYGNSSIDVNLHTSFKIFGRGMEYAFCNVAVENNYDKKQMCKIYSGWIAKGWPGTILKLKEEKNIYWKKEFKEYGLPVLKKHKKAYFAVMPFVCLPRVLAIFLRKLNRLRKKKKGE